MKATGTIDGVDLVLTRTFTAPIDDVWASITRSERLARWYGSWTGDPSSGAVLVTMNAEAEDVPAIRHEIVECVPPRLLAVNAHDDHGHWQLRVRLDEVDGVTTLELRQQNVDLGSIENVAPGWEWYLDRLVAAVAGEELPGLEAFESEYLATGDAYRRLIT